MLIGGPARVGGPSFTTVRETGGEVVWGVGFLLLGVLMLGAARSYPRYPALLFHAYMVAMVGYGLFVWAFLSAAAQMESAALTGIVVYSWVIYLHVMAAANEPSGFRALGQRMRRTR